MIKLDNHKLNKKQLEESIIAHRNTSVNFCDLLRVILCL